MKLVSPCPQFTAWAFTHRARQPGLLPSMGSVGDCFDNAVIESFWGRMQPELLDRNSSRIHRRWRYRHGPIGCRCSRGGPRARVSAHGDPVGPGLHSVELDERVTWPFG